MKQNYGPMPHRELGLCNRGRYEWDFVWAWFRRISAEEVRLLNPSARIDDHTVGIEQDSLADRRIVITHPEFK